MTSTERLYLTSDRRRVVQHGHPLAAFLLVAAGSNIPPQYSALVEAMYADQKQAEPKHEVNVETQKSVDTVEPPVGEDAEGYNTRVLVPKRRGRPRKSSGAMFTGDPQT